MSLAESVILFEYEIRPHVIAVRSLLSSIPLSLIYNFQYIGNTLVCLSLIFYMNFLARAIFPSIYEHLCSRRCMQLKLNTPSFLSCPFGVHDGSNC